MTLMLDTNVLLDMFQGRPSFSDKSGAVLSDAIAGKYIGIVPAHGLTTVYYLLRKSVGELVAIESVDWLLARFTIAPATLETFIRARRLGIRDFEDAVVAAMPEATGCQFIVTRNTADFGSSPVKAIAPEDFLQIRNAT